MECLPKLPTLLESYQPPIIDSAYFERLQITGPDAETLRLLADASISIASTFTDGGVLDLQKLISSRFRFVPMPRHQETLYHGNTPICPRIVELNPVEGCQLSCFYCLAIYTDEFDPELTVYSDYDRYVRELLEENRGAKVSSMDIGFCKI